MHQAAMHFLTFPFRAMFPCPCCFETSTLTGACQDRRTVEKAPGQRTSIRTPICRHPDAKLWGGELHHRSPQDKISSARVSSDRTFLSSRSESSLFCPDPQEVQISPFGSKATPASAQNHRCSSGQPRRAPRSVVAAAIRCQYGGNRGPTVALTNISGNNKLW